MKVSKLRARTSMRHLAGADIPRADTTSFGMRNAMKKAKRASGGVCMGEVDGESKPGRLDKAVMRKCGGRVGRAEGGGNRLSSDSEAKAKAADKAYDESRGFAGPISSKTLGAGGLLGAGVAALGKALTRKSQLGKLFTAVPAAGATYAGAKMAKDDFSEMNEGLRARQEARDIRAMKPIEGYEDRKRGGRIGKRAVGGMLGGAGFGGLKSKVDEAFPDGQAKVADAAAKVASLGMLKRGGKVGKKS